MSDLSNFSLTDLVKGIKKKDFTSLEITKTFVNNSENSTKLNTYITKCFDKAIISAKNFDKKNVVEVKGDCIIPPNSFALCRSVEYFKMPRDVLAICVGKSTYARCGIIVNVTPIEPEWEGHITIEISNTTPLPAKIYANEGIAQLLFIGADTMCDISYGDKGGKYLKQKGITLPKIDK